MYMMVTLLVIGCPGAYVLAGMKVLIVQNIHYNRSVRKELHGNQDFMCLQLLTHLKALEYAQMPS